MNEMQSRKIELAAMSEPVKVELNDARVKQLISGLKAQIGNIERAIDSSTKFYSDFEILKGKLSEQLKTNQSLFKNASELAYDSYSLIQSMKIKASELGINPEQIPSLEELMQLNKKISTQSASIDGMNDKLKSQL